MYRYKGLAHRKENQDSIILNFSLKFTLVSANQVFLKSLTDHRYTYKHKIFYRLVDVNRIFRK